MQFAISDSAAISFARGFYTAIARGRTVDDAARSGRISILGTPHSLEWVTPVLYVRGDATQLFTMTAPPASRRVASPGQTTPEDGPRGHLVEPGDAVVATGKCRGWIDSPSDGDTVGTRIAVRGGVHDVPDSYHLWIAHRVDPGGLLWPKDAEITLDDRGYFEVYVYEGGASPRLYVTLLLVTAEANAAFERWLEEGSRTGHYPGLRLSRGSYVELASVSLRHDPS
jgi:hypothetical protein